MNRTKLAAFALALALAAPFAAVAEDAPGVFKIPGTESTIKFYGYVQLDTTLDFSGRVADIENNDWATTLANVPDDKSPEAKKRKGQLYMTARTSRFGLQTVTPSSWGPVGVKLEGDFNAPNSFQTESYTNSVIFRLRHGYGTIGGLLVGQTWTTFADLNSYADTVDFNGPGDTALVRNPMIRYTFGLGPGMSLSLAAENRRGQQFGPGPRFQTLPDLIAKFDYAGSWGTFSVRGVTQRYNYAFTTTSCAFVDPADPTNCLVPGSTVFADQSPKSYQSFAGAASGSFKVGGDTLVAYFAGGPGIGRYLLDANSPFPVYFDGTDLKAQTVYGGHVGYTHVWTPEFRSNLIGAYTHLVDPKVGGVAATSGNKDLMQVFVNTFWSFSKTAEFGIEYVYGQRKEYAAAGAEAVKGTQNRVNASFHYNFF